MTELTFPSTTEAPAVAGRLDQPVRPEPESSHSGTCTGYAVEARVDGPPREVAGQLLDGEWRRVYFAKAPPGFGVPAQGIHEHQFGPHGLMTHEGAQAMRWWLVACDTPMPFVQTRLMRYEVAYRTSATKLEAVSEITDPFRA